MAELPLLLFPSPTNVTHASRGGGGGKINTPSPGAQKKRLEDKFQNALNSISLVQPTIQGMEPEQVIVFETVGKDIEKLSEVASKIPGLEWLAELDLEDFEPDEYFSEDGKPDAELPHRLYALMTNQQAMTQLLSLWNAWTSDPSKRAKSGFGPFKNLFIHLNDIRRWGPQDRIDQTLIIENWKDTLQSQPNSPSRFEAELWFRKDARLRNAAVTQLTQLAAAQGGRNLMQAAVESIHYHGALIEMPSKAILEMLIQIESGKFSEFLRCEGVMFFRPLGQARFPNLKTADTTPLASVAADEIPLPKGLPRVALLDGLPLSTHASLDGRLLLDDPDGFGERYEAGEQSHGTAMASLVTRGDLQEKSAPLKSPLYVRPIFVPEKQFNGSANEITPSDSLIVDLIHRAILRVAQELDETKTSVRIVNLSLGDAYKPFIRELSPLARLLDWLSWKFNLLILVSAGNQMQPICLPCSGNDFQRMPDDEAVKTVLAAMDGDQSARRHFSPAEAINVVTVGAIHSDSSTPRPNDRRVDLLRGQRLPSPIATVSYGFKRSIKPEVLLPGGRVLYHSPFAPRDGRWEFKASDASIPPGLQVASPSTKPLELDKTVYCCGSSNATALASRTSVKILERLDEVLAAYPDVALDNAEITCLTKALLIHGASWGQAGTTIESLLATPADDWRKRQALKAKFLGYGEVDLNRSLFCTEQRATLLGWGYLTKESAHSYRFPMPPSLSAQKVQRRLIFTLAWLTPINPSHKDYRKAAMWITVNGDSVGVSRENLDQDSAKRGTVIHQIMNGDQGRALPDELEIKVNCVEHARGLVERIPYGLAVSLEVAEGIAIPIYNEVQARIRPRVPINP